MQIIKILKKFRLILSRHQKFRVCELALMMVIGGILETCSVSLVLPFTNAVVNPKDTMEKWYAIAVCKLLAIDSIETFLVVLAIALASLYIIKNIFLMFEFSMQYRFVYGNMFEMQKTLLHTYINRPYESFLEVSSGEIVRIINNDIMHVFNLLVVLLSLFTEMVVSVMLVAAIFVMAPNITVYLSILLAALLFFIFVAIKPVLRRAGLNEQTSRAGMNKWLLQAVEGIKEIKVMQKELFFQHNFDKNGSIYIKSLRWNQLLGIAPRFIIEAICMGGMFILVALLIYQGAHLQSLAPALTAVAMAAIRLLPAVNRIANALSQIAYNEPMLDKVIENLNVSNEAKKNGDIQATNNKSAATLSKLKQEINIENIYYRYPNSHRPILIDASMKIKKGESVGIIGASGAGKTTFVDLLLGLLIPQSGRIQVDYADIRDDYPGWTRQIGYIPQMIFMLDDSICANVAFGENAEDQLKERVWQAIREAALEDFVKGLPDGLDTQIGERGVRLSGGQRQRIGIARALYRNPEIIVFDEATSALDNETETAIMESIHSLQGKKTMIIIAHRLTTIEACDHIFEVENGKIKKKR